MTTTKRLLASVLSLIMAISCFAVVPVMADEPKGYDTITGVTLVNQQLDAGYDPAKVTFDDVASKITAHVSAPYVSANNTLQISGMSQSEYTALITGRTNLATSAKQFKIQGWTEKDANTWTNLTSFGAYAKFTDGKIYDTSTSGNAGATDGLAQQNWAAKEYTGSEKGTARVEVAAYDYRITIELDGQSSIDAFSLMGHVNPSTANSVYKVYVGDNEANLYDAANEVFYYDQTAVYNAYTSNIQLNGLAGNMVLSGQSGKTMSDGTFLTFGGETKPAGKFVGIELIESAPAQSGWVYIFDMGIFGTKNETTTPDEPIVPDEPTDSNISGVTLVNQKLRDGYDSAKITFNDIASKIKATVSAPYASEDNTLQITGMNQSEYTALINGRTNLVSTAKVKWQPWADKGTDTWKTVVSNLPLLTDGKIYDVAAGNTNGFAGLIQSDQASNDYDNAVVGDARIEAGGYDHLITTTLSQKSYIDAFTIMGHLYPSTAVSTYEVYVGDDEATLYDAANKVFFYDQRAAYNAYGAGISINGQYGSNYLSSGASEAKMSEGAWLTFGGETKPVGKFVGIKVIDSAPMQDGWLQIFELGLYGTPCLNIIEPTLKEGATTTESGLDWATKKAKLSADSVFEGTTLQVDNVYDSTLKALGNNLVEEVLVEDSHGTSRTYNLANVTDGDILDHEGKSTSDYCQDYFSFSEGDYDATVTLSLKGEVAIDTIYNFAHPGRNLAWCTYKMYVGNDKATLYDDKNEIASFDYFNGYSAGDEYTLNGTHATVPDDATLRRSEGQIWKFTEDKPTGAYVGYKIIYAETFGKSRLDIYDVGVFGTCYEAIQTIHNEHVEVVSCDGYLSFVPGAQKQFKVNTYAGSQVTAVKMVKDGEEDILLTADGDVYTTPKLEEGMKIKVETTTDDTSPMNGVWNGIDLSKNSSVYDPKIWDDGITYNESAMIYDGRTTVKLLYPIDEVISVRSYDLQTAYYPGKDYIVTADGQLQIPEGSSIKVYDKPEKFTNIIKDKNGNYDVDWTAVSSWETIQWKHQIMVTYKHTSTWGNDALYETKPAGEMASLSSFFNKATSGETTNVVFYGDSVGLGCSSTGLNEGSWSYKAYNVDAPQLERITATKASSYGLDANNLPDWVCDTWPRAIANALKKQYGDNITYTNRSIGGTESSWGAKSANLDFLLGEGDTENPCPVPDLLFIHYGLNEMNTGKDAQKANIEKIINYVRARNENCAVVLVSAFHPAQFTKEENPVLTSGNIPLFEDAYYELANEYDNVIVAPIYSMTESMLSVKTPMDYTHNLFNHPNDFGSRVYASTIMSLLDATTADGLTIEVAKQVEYAGKVATPSVTVKLGGKVLKENVNYTLAYSNNDKIGEATITITGMNGIEGTATKTFQIVHTTHKYTNSCDTTCNYCSAKRTIKHSYSNDCDKSCNVCGASRSVGSHKYSNDCDKSCNVCGATRSVGSHKYSNSCDTSCNVCKATRSISHSYKTTTTKATTSKNGSIVKKCSVCGKVSSTTTIYRIKSVSLSTSTYTYNGKTKKPSVKVKDYKGKTVSSSYYTVSYASGRKSIGKYKVTVTFKGRYSGTKTLYFKINPQKVSSLKLKSSKKKELSVSWKKDSKVSGYEIVYATNSKFTKSKKTVKITSYKTYKKTIKKLSSKKTYYVKVRAYKTVKGTKYYGSYCSYKKLKIK